jgi:hypothetical protein
MFIHAVLMRLSDGADDAFHRKVDDFVNRIRAELPYIREYYYGKNLANRANGLTWAVVGLFESSSDHDRYQVSPIHQEMKAYMTPYIDAIVACDMECER